VVTTAFFLKGVIIIMGAQTWGSGIDTFGINYLDANVSNDWTSNDADDHPITAFQCKELKAYFTSAESTATSGVTDENMSMKMQSIGGSNKIIINTNTLKAENGFFTQACLLWNDGSNKHIITDVSDIQRMVWKPSVIVETKTRNKPDGTSLTYKTYTINTTNNQGTMDIYKKSDNTQTVTTDRLIMPWLINPDYTNKLMNHYSVNNSDEINYWGGSTARQNCTYYQNTNQNRYRPNFTVEEPLPNGNNLSFVIPSDDGNFVCEVSYSTNNFATVGCTVKISSEHMLKLWLASSGLKFKYNNVVYKPIVINGVVTGYTDDMSTVSEWDNWHDYNDHVVPDVPPAPGPSPGYDDDPWSGVSFSGVGLGGGGAFARCYYMTSTELANLRTWMCGVGVPEGFNPMAQIIGLSQVPVALSGDAPETVQFINSSAVYDPGVTSRVVDSGVSTQYSMGGPIKYSLGSVDIVRRMQERGEPYLDYSCQVELYLPLIGMFSLDTQAVMGRSIEAEAILDPISGTLAAYAWVSKDGQKLPIAYGSTTISVDLPVTAQQYSVSKAALKQANAQLGTSLLSSVATLVAAAVGGGKAESSNARVSGGASSMQGARGMNSYAQASSIAASQAAISQTGNVVGDFMQWGRTIKQLQYGNNTAISGSFGGSVAQWSYPFQAYVKINRPRYEKPRNYAHSQGVPCVQTKRIGDCTGFIQCIGVDVINIEGATDLERQAIQAALSSGIYAGGGSE